jgi:hypothetical protein
MPRYKNTSDRPIQVGLFGVINPGEEIESYHILDHLLTRISDEPYFNPVVLSEDYTISSGNTQEITISETKTPTTIKITCKSGNIEVYFNSLSNTPPLKLFQGESISINNPTVYDKIILKAIDNSECYVVVLRNMVV